MLHEHVPLFERAFVEQEGDALAGGQLALGMLGLNAFLAAAKAGMLALLLKRLDDLLHGHAPVCCAAR
jgi:hypothetical protein